MARSAAERKAETRRRIIETASERFKQDGIDGSGIATLMSDAGLTNGAFYAHFSSKGDLVANVVADQLRAQRDSLSSLPSGRDALEAFVREYLSPRHRDHPGTGCPNAALLDEIGRCDDAVRDAYTEGMQSIVDVIHRAHHGRGVVHCSRRHLATRTRRLRPETVRRHPHLRNLQRTTAPRLQA
jgi:AcrR family transcriptional regulator